MKQIATLFTFLLFFVLKTNGQTDATFAQPNTLDIVTWNMNWFGNLTYGPQTPANEYRQRQNAKTVLTTLAADIFELNEVCSLDSLSLLVAQMPGYSSVCCTETSYNSADGQRSCFVYKTAMFSNIKTKPLLKTIKDDPSVLVGYPVAGATGYTHFWSSGRLPFAMTADVTLNGATRRIMFVGFHAKAYSTAEDRNRREYDAKVLKDTLDAQYSALPLVLLGDFNDDLDVSIYQNLVTPYNNFKSDTRYSLPTLALSQAGQQSTTGFNSMIDHFIFSQKMTPSYVASSARVGTPTTYITSYASSTSDHYPVMLRVNLASVIPVTLLDFSGKMNEKTQEITLNWSTASERDNARFVVERSFDAVNFMEIGVVNGAGSTTKQQDYTFIDPSVKLPSGVGGTMYYRLKQVDFDGSFTLSKVISIENGGKTSIRITPNPVGTEGSVLQIEADGTAFITLTDLTGKVVFEKITEEKTVLLDTSDLPSGLYFCTVRCGGAQVLAVQKLVVR